MQGRYLPLLAAAVLCGLPASLSAQEPRNILVIVADDLGVDYVGAYKEGAHPPPTPNIDSLAERGVLFRNTWAHPNCSPTRACLVTGRFPVRTFVGRWIPYPVNNARIGTLDHSEWTIPEVLDRGHSGYAHACIGKWHLNDGRPGLDAPRTVGGFSHFAGSLIGQISSYNRWTRVVNGVAGVSTRYHTAQATDDALAWVRQRGQDQPWFLYLAYQAPHIPYHAPPSHLHTQDLADLAPKPLVHTSANRPFYKAAVEALDTEIGRLFASLGDEVLRRTNVIFIADNGTVEQQAEPPFDKNRAKQTPYEGGVNVPLIIAGPDVVSGGREVTALACAVDVFATVLELAGAMSALPKHVVHDSVSLVPYLHDPSQAPLRKFAYSELFVGNAWPSPTTNGFVLARNDRYKLIRAINIAEQMFDLEVDPWETNDLLRKPLDAQQRQAYEMLAEEIRRMRSPGARFVVIGQGGCQGSQGHPVISATGRPRLSSTFWIHLRNAAPDNFAILTTGISMTRWGNSRLPLNLKRWGGGSNCLLSSAPDHWYPILTSADGTARLQVRVPSRPRLVGTELFHSWLIFDSAAPNNALGIVSTTAAVSVLGL